MYADYNYFFTSRFAVSIWFIMSISSLIPFHYREDENTFFKVRSIVRAIAVIAIVQCITAFGFLILESNYIELAMNLSTSAYALISIFLIRYFKSIETYVNVVLSGFYLFVFTFIIINGGLLSDAVFWLAILLTVNILCTKKRDTLIWAGIVSVFIVVISLMTIMGFDFKPPHYDQTYRILNLMSFFSPLLISVMVFSSLSKKSNRSQKEHIGRLEKLHDEKSDIIDVITHDLKSPANRILGLIQIMDRSNLREEQLEIIELIKQTNDSSSNIINSLLGPSKYNKDKAEAYDLEYLLQDLKKSYSASAALKDISINLSISGKQMLAVNKFQLIRILDNLITNAIKFSQVGGEVKIGAYQDTDSVKVLVTDSGPGFSEGDRELLFQKATSLTAKPTGNEASHGLGLYIVKKLSIDLGIHVNLIETSATGSTFEVSIPI